MSTTLVNSMTELSKQLGDNWESTTTGAGADTTLVDAALMAKANDWITDNAYAFLVEEPASAAAIYDERKISSLDNSTGTLTTLTFAAAPGTGIDYQVHRLFTPSEKRTALIAACRRAFPKLHKDIRDVSKVSGNWLKDGSFEIWTTSSTLTYWTATGVVLAQTSTAGLVKQGTYSAWLKTTAGSLSRTITNDDELMRLAGKSVTFTVQGKSNTASSLRIGIYDGTTTTYSSYCDQTTGWTKDNEPLTVTATIQDHPSAVTFLIYHDVAASTDYVDDARVITSENPGIHIGDLGLNRNTPHRVEVEPSDYFTGEPWEIVRDWVIDEETGYLYLPDSCPKDLRLRISGIGTLDFLVSGSSSTAWTATININQPQLDILIAEAMLYLCAQKILPTDTSGDTARWKESYQYWIGERQRAVAMFGMKAPSATISWGSG